MNESLVNGEADPEVPNEDAAPRPSTSTGSVTPVINILKPGNMIITVNKRNLNACQSRVQVMELFELVPLCREFIDNSWERPRIYCDKEGMEYVQLEDKFTDLFSYIFDHTNEVYYK